jgi:2-dehydro-3-deoxyphosphooctonate aldolase (KDO 8-P synthase)
MSMSEIKPKEFSIGYGKVKKVKVGKYNPLVFIGGPCAIESRDHTLKMAYRIKKICKKLKLGFVFKSCFNKDCRSSPESFNGVGLDEGLKILQEVREKINVPVVSDFSNPSWAKPTGEVVDLIQVPAYLCRQTSILRAAAETKKPILLKKGQFMSPWNMKNSIRKIEYYGNNKVLLADRGTFFGYNMLVNDMRCFPIMSETGYPVCYDATHSIQMPTSMGNISGGQREFIPPLVRSATACGINALFMEVHDNPSKAKSDPNTVLDIVYLERILIMAKKMHEERIKLDKKYGNLNVK